MPDMLRRRAFLWLLSSVALVGAVTTASADPIPITVIGGFIEFQPVPAGPESFGRFELIGTDGFRMSAGGTAVTSDCLVCAPGPVRLDLRVFADSGSITYQGVTREFESGPLTPGGGELFVSARSVVLPPVGSAEVVRFETSFSLDPLNSIVGAPVLSEPEGPPPPPEQVFTLSGGGRGEATFRRESENFWVLDSMRFDFEDQAAIPEPSSMLLVGSVLSGVWLRRRFRARRR
jgi:hypothetical protein